MLLFPVATGAKPHRLIVFFFFPVATELHIHMKEKKLHIISCLILLIVSILNYYFNNKIMWTIFIFSSITLYLSLTYKLKYKNQNTDFPTGMWLIEYGVGFNIFEIVFNLKSTLLGSIFIVLGLLFALESNIRKKEKN